MCVLDWRIFGKSFMLSLVKETHGCCRVICCASCIFVILMTSRVIYMDLIGKASAENGAEGGEHLLFSLPWRMVTVAIPES